MQLSRFNTVCLTLVGLVLLMGATIPTKQTFPAPKVLAISASASALDPRPYSLLITGDGTLAVENRDGTTVSIAVLAGQELHFQPYKITNLGGATVVGMYDNE